MNIGDTLRGDFVVTNLSTGAEENAAVLPTAVLYRNNSVVGTAPTVTANGSGHYHASVLLDAGDGWAIGEHFCLVASWTDPGEEVAKKQILAQGRIGVTVSSMEPDTITAAAAAADFGAEIAALVETYIVNEGDATAVMQAIADVIAADWVAGDATPLAIVAALKADAEWSNLADIASSIENLNDLDAAGVRSALGLAAANLDTQLGTIDNVVDAILQQTGTDGVALSSATRDAIATSLLTLTDGVESGLTVRHALQGIFALVAAKLRDVETENPRARDFGDTKDRVSLSVDADNNRDTVTYDWD